MDIPSEERRDIQGMIDDGEIVLEDMTAAEISVKMRMYGYEATPDWIDANLVEFDEHIEGLAGPNL